MPNFTGSSLSRFPLVSADCWTSDHLSERSRSADAFFGTRARGTLTLNHSCAAQVVAGEFEVEAAPADGVASAPLGGEGDDAAAARRLVGWTLDQARGFDEAQRTLFAEDGASQCGNQPLVWGVLTKLQTPLARSNRSRFG